MRETIEVSVSAFFNWKVCSWSRSESIDLGFYESESFLLSVWWRWLFEVSKAMAGSQDKLAKMKLRQDYRNLWHSDLMGTVTADTPCKSHSLFDISNFIVCSIGELILVFLVCLFYSFCRLLHLVSVVRCCCSIFF